MKVTIYHNPRCSKSRQTLSLLQDKGIDVEVIEYLKTPPDNKQLTAILDKLGISAADLLRRKEKAFKELEVADILDDQQALINVMIANPVLIERPIVLANNKAVIGRPPENVLDII